MKTLSILSFLAFYSIAFAQPKDLVFKEAEIQLFYSIHLADTAMFDSLLMAGTSPNAEFFEQITVLSYAAGKGNTYFIEKLIDKGANVNGVTLNGLLQLTPAVFAIKYKRNDALELLLQRGATITFTQPALGGFNINFGGGTPPPVDQRFSLLAYAAIQNNSEAVNILNELNPPVDALSSGKEGFQYFGLSPLMIAAKLGHNEIVRSLLNKGASPSQYSVDLMGATQYNSLMLAVGSGDTLLLKLILDSGVDINAESGSHITALMEAGRLANLESVTFLLNHGANPRVIDAMGNTIVQRNINFHIYFRELEMNRLSNFEGEQLQLVGMMENAKYRWDMPDSVKRMLAIQLELLEKETYALLIRPWTGRIDLKKEADAAFLDFRARSIAVVDILASTNIDLNHRDQTNKTALMQAANLSLHEIMEVLIMRGASSVGAPPEHLLRLAIYKNDLNRFNQLLTQHGASLGSTDRAFLMNLAVTKKDLRFPEAMKNVGFDLNSGDERGISPLLVAAMYGDTSIVNGLIRLGADKNYSKTPHVKPYTIARFMDNTAVMPLLVPDFLINESTYEAAHTSAAIEGMILQGNGSVKASEIWNYHQTVSMLLSDSLSYLNNPLVNWLTQSFDDNVKNRLASAVFRQSPLVINGTGNSLANYKIAQDYRSFAEIGYKTSIQYKNGTNNGASLEANGPVKFDKREDCDDSRDAPTWIGVEVAGGEVSWYGESIFSVWTGTYAGACGGWDNKCLTVVNGECWSFMDPKSRSSSLSLDIRGSMTIPGVDKVNGYFAAFSKMTVYNEDNSVPIRVEQGGQTTTINPKETRHFDRQAGNLKIVSAWNDDVRGSGSNCDEHQKRSFFAVEFPGTYDVYLIGEESAFSDRLTNYSRILTHRIFMRENASKMKSYELYAGEALIHLLSEKCKERYKPVIKAELNGIVDFFENTDFREFNDALVLLAEREQLDIPEVQGMIENLLGTEGLEPTVQTELMSIQTSMQNASLEEIRYKLNSYKNHYMEIFGEKKELYNRLLLEYAMYIPNEKLVETLALERVPLYREYFNSSSKERFQQ